MVQSASPPNSPAEIARNSSASASPTPSFAVIDSPVAPIKSSPSRYSRSFSLNVSAAATGLNPSNMPTPRLCCPPCTLPNGTPHPALQHIAHSVDEQAAHFMGGTTDKCTGSDRESSEGCQPHILISTAGIHHAAHQSDTLLSTAQAGEGCPGSPISPSGISIASTTFSTAQQVYTSSSCWVLSGYTELLCFCFRPSFGLSEHSNMVSMPFAQSTSLPLVGTPNMVEYHKRTALH